MTPEERDAVGALADLIDDLIVLVNKVEGLSEADIQLVGRAMFAIRQAERLKLLPEKKR